MHNWLMRNLTLLAFLLILGVIVIAGLALVPALVAIFGLWAAGPTSGRCL